MTVYVGTGIADKPLVQHLAAPVPDEWTSRQLSLCRFYILTAEQHDRARRSYGFGKPLTPIDYERLPMCKRCTKIHEKAMS